MKLLVYELLTTLDADLTVGANPLQLYAIRPRLYRHGSPTGSLTLQILDSIGQLVGVSETIAISAIGTGSYWHGVVRFLVALQLKESTQYKLRLVPSGGYVFGEAAYIGWCNGFDLGVVTSGYPSAIGVNAPLDFEVWAKSQQSRRVG